MTRPKVHHGFTLIELLVVVAIIAVLVGLLLPALSSARTSARTLQCMSNMRQLGAGSKLYSITDDERLPAFWWTGDGDYSTQYEDLTDPGGSDRVAVMYQARALVRDRSGVSSTAGSTFAPWFANLWYTHLLFQDFLTGAGEEPTAVCPEDFEQRERFETPIEEFTNSNINRKFESSYETTVLVNSVDIERGGVRPMTQHNNTWNGFTRDNNYLVTRRTTEVVFPSSKAYMFDTFERHAGDPESGKFLFEPGVQQPILFFDGSVRNEFTDDANPGFRPRFPKNPDPSLIKISFSDSDGFAGVYRWTRGGLKGIDFGAKEISTGQD